MEISEEPSKKNMLKKCFQPKQEVIKPLSIVSNNKNSFVLFWNKYQLFCYEYIGEVKNDKYFIPEFQLQRVIALDNLIICLDTCGNIHTTTLKFKSASLPKVKISFQPRFQNVVALLRTEDNNILTIMNASNECYLGFHKGNAEVQLTKKIKFNLEEENRVPKLGADDVIFTSAPLHNNCKIIKDLFQIETFSDDLTFVIISFDKQNMFCCVVSKFMNDHIKLLKLYTCPSRICDIKVQFKDDEINVLIGLNVGTVIMLPLSTKVPSTIYLNTAMHKFEIQNTTLIYTDGNTMWKAEDFMSNIKFKQIQLRSVNDFIYMRDCIIATTFINFIYSINEEKNLQDQTRDVDYTPSEKILDNMGNLDKILQEVDKNKQLLKKMDQEKNYLTALALSNRQDLVSKMVKCQILVYDSYEDVVKQESNLVLTESLKEYFEPNSVLIAIKIDFTDLKSNFDPLLNDLRSPKIHLAFESLGKLIKTNSTNVKALSSVTNILVPLNTNDITNNIAVHIKLLPKIPGSYDKKEKTWCVLYKNTVILKSEQFIKCNYLENALLLNKKSTIEDLITQIARNDHGSLFKIKDIKQDKLIWCLYVQLPKNYDEILQNEVSFSEQLAPKQATFLAEKFKCADFLQSKTNVLLHILNTNTNLEIYKEDFTDNVKLKITSTDVGVAHNLRAFFSKILLKYHPAIGTDNVYIDSKLYTVTENLQKQLRECIQNNADSETLMPVLEVCYKNVLSVLQI